MSVDDILEVLTEMLIEHAHCAYDDAVMKLWFFAIFDSWSLIELFLSTLQSSIYGP